MPRRTVRDERTQDQGDHEQKDAKDNRVGHQTTDYLWCHLLAAMVYDSVSGYRSGAHGLKGPCSCTVVDTAKLSFSNPITHPFLSLMRITSSIDYHSSDITS